MTLEWSVSQLKKLSNLFTEKGEALPKELEIQLQEKGDSKSSGKDHTTDVDEDPVAAERRDKVKDAMLHAWNSYERYAWGYDELKVFTHGIRSKSLKFADVIINII